MHTRLCETHKLYSYIFGPEANIALQIKNEHLKKKKDLEKMLRNISNLEEQQKKLIEEEKLENKQHESQLNATNLKSKSQKKIAEKLNHLTTTIAELRGKINLLNKEITPGNTDSRDDEKSISTRNQNSLFSQDKIDKISKEVKEFFEKAFPFLSDKEEKLAAQNPMGHALNDQKENARSKEVERGAFRKALKTLNANHLNKMLFPESSLISEQNEAEVNPEENVDETLSIPSDKIIEARFNKLESIYHFFDDEKASLSSQKIALEKFTKIYKLLKLLDRFFDSSEKISLQAYKILTIFDNPLSPTKGFDELPDSLPIALKALDTYLNKHNIIQNDNPIEAAFENKPLPTNGIPIKIYNLPEWRKTILEHGPQALNIFGIAPDIQTHLVITELCTELKLNKQDFDKRLVNDSEFKKHIDNVIKTRAPKSWPNKFEGLRALALPLKYERANENPELALLAFEMGASSQDVNECFELLGKLKSDDFLPSPNISGKEVMKFTGTKINLEGYHFVKLPINDIHAFFLGQLTYCCQHIGGDSAQCIRDGLLLKNNGFYVLLKEKNPAKKDKMISSTTIAGKSSDETKTSSPIINGKIDYKKFKIVGQGYAWKSKEGNLVIDSWENRYSSESTSKFNDDPVIVPFLKYFSKQVVEDKKLDILRVTIGSGGKTPKDEFEIAPYPETMLEGIQYRDSFSQGTITINEVEQKKLFDNIISSLKKIIFDTPLDHKNDEQVIKDLFSEDYIYSIQQAKSIQNVLEKNEVIKTILKDPDQRDELIKIIQNSNAYIWNTIGLLNDTNMFNADIAEQLFNCFKTDIFLNLPAFYNSLQQLKQYQLINQSNLKLILNNFEASNTLVDSLIILKKAGIPSDKIIPDLLKYPFNAPQIANAYAELQQANLYEHFSKNILVNDSIKNGFIELVSSGLNILKDIIYCYTKLLTLNKFHPGFFQTIMQEASKDSRNGLTKTLRILLENELFDSYHTKIFNKPYSDYIAAGLVELQEAKLLNKYDNIIIEQGYGAFNVAKGLTILNNANLLDQYDKIIINKNGHADIIAAALKILHDKKLLDTFDKIIIEKDDFALEVATAISMLQDSDLIQTYYKSILDKNQHATTVTSALIKLQEAKLLNDYSQIILSKDAHALIVATAFAKLKEAKIPTDYYRPISDKTQYANDIAIALINLQNENIPTKYYQAVIDSEWAALRFSDALCTLQRANMLDDRYIKYFIAFPGWSASLIEVFATLPKNILANEDILKIILSPLEKAYKNKMEDKKFHIYSTNSYINRAIKAANIFTLAQKVGFTIPESFRAELDTHRRPEYERIYHIIQELHKENLLNEKNFILVSDFIKSYHKSILRPATLEPLRAGSGTADIKLSREDSNLVTAWITLAKNNLLENESYVSILKKAASYNEKQFKSIIENIDDNPTQIDKIFKELKTDTDKVIDLPLLSPSAQPSLQSSLPLLSPKPELPQSEHSMYQPIFFTTNSPDLEISQLNFQSETKIIDSPNPISTDELVRPTETIDESESKDITPSDQVSFNSQRFLATKGKEKPDDAPSGTDENQAVTLDRKNKTPNA